MLRQESFKLSGMSCAACSARIEKKLNSLDGVNSAAVNLAAQKAAVLYDPVKIKADDLIKAVQGLGYDAALIKENSNYRKNEEDDLEIKTLRSLFIASAILAFPLILAMFFSIFMVRINALNIIYNPYFQLLLLRPFNL